MKWWGPVGLIAGIVLAWFGYDLTSRALHIGWSSHLPHLMVGVAFLISGPFVAVVALVNARRFGRD